jgi:hypothetical protein
MRAGYGHVFLGEFDGMQVAVKAVHGEKVVTGDGCIELGEGEDEHEDDEHVQQPREEKMAQLEAVSAVQL